MGPVNTCICMTVAHTEASFAWWFVSDDARDNRCCEACEACEAAAWDTGRCCVAGRNKAPSTPLWCNGGNNGNDGNNDLWDLWDLWDPTPLCLPPPSTTIVVLVDKAVVEWAYNPIF